MKGRCGPVTMNGARVGREVGGVQRQPQQVERPRLDPGHRVEPQRDRTC